jgi:hypothetical protein
MPVFRPLVFLNKFLNLQKLDILCPGRFVSWTFCNWTLGNWTFSILDVLYPRCSVTGRYVTGRFVGVPSLAYRLKDHGIPKIQSKKKRQWVCKTVTFLI